MKSIRSPFSSPGACLRRLLTALGLLGLASFASAVETVGTYVIESGHPSLREWLLPEPPHPKDNAPTPPRVELGKQLFFDPRIGGDGNMSCASCHNPMLGWSDGLPTARGHRGKLLGRATPPITNSAYSYLLMWDGRKRSLEDQALGPMEAAVEMNTDLDQLLDWLAGNEQYRAAFARAYPGEPIARETVAKAIASFERTVVARDTPFDRWVAGDRSAMTAAQVRGFAVFVDPQRGNCAACHSAPNFSDDSFHNLGLASWGNAEPDVGRFAEKPIKSMRGAFRTPSLREVARTAPYFHDGSAGTLEDVIEHYVKGGVVTTDLSPEMRALELGDQERADLLAFMHALTGEPITVALPDLPLDGPEVVAAKVARKRASGSVAAVSP